jgi:predicted transposase/invertase (TIGR01784 family)
MYGSIYLAEVNNMLTAIADEIMEKGKREEKLEVAKKMKDEGLDISLISKITSLTVEEIEKL